jgi:hypothetical protein
MTWRRRSRDSVPWRRGWAEECCCDRLPVTAARVLHTRAKKDALMVSSADRDEAADAALLSDLSAFLAAEKARVYRSNGWRTAATSASPPHWMLAK